MSKELILKSGAWRCSKCGSENLNAEGPVFFVGMDLNTDGYNTTSGQVVSDEVFARCLDCNEEQAIPWHLQD